MFSLRQSHQALADVNTEPSQSEQIIWDDPTAREERARLVSNFQWPDSPSQHTEQGQSHTSKNVEESVFRGPSADAEIAGMVKPEAQQPRSSLHHLLDLWDFYNAVLFEFY